MKFLHNLLKELESTSSTNAKVDILKRYQNDSEVRALLTLTYDKVTYKYNITNHVLNYSKWGTLECSPNEMWAEILEALATRKYTGNTAIQETQKFIDTLTPESQYVFKCIIDRDLHCGLSMKLAERVFKNFYFKLPYMGCSGIDSLKNISFPAFLQLKADGTYRTAIVRDSDVEFYSRSGESYNHPSVAEELSKLPDGVYIGEMIVNSDALSLEENSKASENRYASNGALNSLNPPEDVTYFLWDYLCLEDFQNVQTNVPYKVRFDYLQSILMNMERLQAIETCIVNNYEEAKIKARELMLKGFEGAVLKDFDVKFEDKHSKYQIKMKNEFDVDVKCTGFTVGNGKFAKTFGAIEFESSDGLLKGQCSGIPDSLRNEINSNKESLIGKIFSVKANDITLAKNSKIYGLMHPQFKEFRTDKTEADSLERIIELSKGF